MSHLLPEEALALWNEFPIDRRPRPIVLMSFSLGPGGYPMLEDRADVLRHAAVVSDVDMPAWLLVALQPDPKPHWQVDPVRGGRDGVPADARARSGGRALVADRAGFELSRWVERAAAGRAAGRRPDGQVDGARGAAGVHRPVGGAVLESRTAVVLVLDGATRPGVEAIPMVAVGRVVTAKLTEPLADRVLLQADGIPIEVIPV
jgi:hypothetical protein